MITLISKLIEGFKSNSIEEFLGSFLVFSIIMTVLVVIKKTSAGDKKGEDEDT